MNKIVKAYSVALLASVFLITTFINQSFARGNGTGTRIKKTTVRKIRFSDGVIAVKFRDHVNALNKSTLSAFPRLNKKIVRHNVYATDKAFYFLEGSTRKKAEHLLKVFYFKYGSGEYPVDVALDFATDPNVEYAEPVPIVRLFETPNDSLFTQQAHFDIIKAAQAWDVIKGEDGNVIIAIVDGGTDWQHQDLRDNIWVNEDEVPNNGIDDDNNGFVDDIRGWNFAANSNDPKGRSTQTVGYQHGTQVAGISTAVTNNLLGVAGVSWNCQLMPVNVASRSANNDSTLGLTYEGIVYAADNGADVINSSWGSPFRSNLQQEVIDFAYANGSLVVAAAGNQNDSNDELPQFPSNYNHVLAVGSTRNSDVKSSFSNYGVTVNVFAPGEAILSTQPDNEYGIGFGTSFSTPIVTGVAGLVKTLHSDWSVDQVREQIRVTADDLDSKNAALAGLLGKGRVNAFRAVTITGLPAIRIVSASYTDSSGDGRVDPGEQANLTVRFTNFLEDASTLSFTLSSDDPNVIISNANANLANLNTNDTLGVSFQFELLSEVQDGHKLSFITDISTAEYSDRDFSEIVINPPLFNDHNTGTLQTSITNQGNIGFIDFAEQSPGVGFVFNSSNLLFSGGLMFGTGVPTVSDCIRGEDGSTQDDDFRATSKLSLIRPGEVSDEYGSVSFDDAFAANPLEIDVFQETFTYDLEPFNDFVIYKYTLKNQGNSNVENLYTGLFFDWDINSDALDHARFDNVRDMGVVQNSAVNPTRLAATKVLTNIGVSSYRSIHNRNEADTLTDIKKWNYLSNGIQTQTLDNLDVSTLTSTGPFSLEPDQSVEVAFAVIGAGSSDELLANAQAAQFLWNNDLIPEIDLSPPGISTSVLQNPAASKYADIVVVSDRSLQSTPQVKVWVGTDTTSVGMSAIPGTVATYKGPFEFTESGTYTIQTNAIGAVNGVDSTQTRSFATTLAKPGASTFLSTLDKKAALHIDEYTVQGETYFIADYQETDSETIYHFGPTARFNAPLNLEIIYNENSFSDPGKIFIFQKRGEEWVPLDTRVFPDLHKAKAQVSELGEFKIAYNPDFNGTNLVPEEFSLSQNYPNPFNPTTIIEYALPDDKIVELTVFNSLGQAVRTLHKGRQFAGNYQVQWDGTDEHGRRVASGVFFYRIKAGNFIETRKMILLR